MIKDIALLVKSVNTDNMSLYLNFPFCSSRCTYCHYTNNLKFGYTEIPQDYFCILLSQLRNVCNRLYGNHFKSIYFGGGTPSLLSDTQLMQIEDILKSSNITSSEISMELHPSYCNFDFSTNTFITRYSLAVQSFDKKVLEKYNRNYSANNIEQIIAKLRNKHNNCTINIDLIFNEEISDLSLTYAKKLSPDSITVYPNTKCNGVKRLLYVIRTLQHVKEYFSDDYSPLARSTFIFLKKGTVQSEYSKLECETFGDIIGIGHNSISSIAEKTYLTLYNDGNVLINERIDKGNRFIVSFLSSLPIGVTLGSVNNFFPQLLDGNFLYTVEGDRDINEKHTLVANNELVYLPETEYIRFYLKMLSPYHEIYKRAFLSSIGYGDVEYKTIYTVYNELIHLPQNEDRELRNLISNDSDLLFKYPVPQLLILIEGIDGSGKDTFVHYFTRELKQRFQYHEKFGISVMGQPDSKVIYGVEAKKFVEELVYDEKNNVSIVLSANRIASEKKIAELHGIRILIRGIITDKATYNYVFHSDADLGEGKIIKKWDSCIVIKVEPKVADERIQKRGIPRTWRESLEHLEYFSDFYLNYESDLFSEKLIIENRLEKTLQYEARKLADKIYANNYTQRKDK